VRNVVTTIEGEVGLPIRDDLLTNYRDRYVENLSDGHIDKLSGGIGMPLPAYPARFHRNIGGQYRSPIGPVYFAYRCVATDGLRR